MSLKLNVLKCTVSKFYFGETKHILIFAIQINHLLGETLFQILPIKFAATHIHPNIPCRLTYFYSCGCEFSANLWLVFVLLV